MSNVKLGSARLVCSPTQWEQSEEEGSEETEGGEVPETVHAKEKAEEKSEEKSEDIEETSAEKTDEEKEVSGDESVEESENREDPVGEGQENVAPVIGNIDKVEVSAESPVVVGVSEEKIALESSKAAGKRKMVSDKEVGVTPRSSRRRLIVDDVPAVTSAGGVPEGIVLDGVWFASAALSRQWDTRKSWVIIPEKVMVEESWNKPEALKLVKNLGLLGTLTMRKPSVHQIVLEAAANINSEFGEPGHPEYGVVYVRKEKVIITPSIINSYFGIKNTEYVTFPELGKIAEIIIGEKIQRAEGGVEGSGWSVGRYSLSAGGEL